MRWKGRRQSTNVDDRRGESPGVAAASTAPALLRIVPLLIRSKGGRTLLIIGAALYFGSALLGIDIGALFSGGSATQQREFQPSAQEQELAQFVSVVLADTEDTWHEIFAASGQRYREPTLVLFSGRVNSACGFATAAVGPFYCPADQKLYIDLSFFADLANRHGAPGDFAQAYVVAHEVGHHVQTLLGTSQAVHRAKAGRSQAEANALSVRQELQADCYAGVWGNAARAMLDPGDLEEALDAASAIGDDRLQREAGGRVVPDSFTHGTSAQRVQWFRTGFESGDVTACDTFN